MRPLARLLASKASDLVNADFYNKDLLGWLLALLQWSSWRAHCAEAVHKKEQIVEALVEGFWEQFLPRAAREEPSNGMSYVEQVQCLVAEDDSSSLRVSSHGLALLIYQEMRGVRQDEAFRAS